MLGAASGMGRGEGEGATVELARFVEPDRGHDRQTCVYGCSMNWVWTIGYERATQAALIQALKAAGVEMLIDVRAIAASRRVGFSKTLLAASLAEGGIAYLHLRDLGTPKAGREAARAGRCDEMRAIFSGHLEAPQAVAAFERLADAVRAHRACLLCYEADPSCCHRAVLAERLQQRTPTQVAHLSASPT